MAPFSETSDLRAWRYLHPDELTQVPDGFLMSWESGCIVHLTTPRARRVFERLTGKPAAPYFIHADAIGEFFLSCDEMSLWIKPLD